MSFPFSLVRTRAATKTFLTATAVSYIWYTRASAIKYIIITRILTCSLYNIILLRVMRRSLRKENLNVNKRDGQRGEGWEENSTTFVILVGECLMANLHGNYISRWLAVCDVRARSVIEDDKTAVYLSHHHLQYTCTQFKRTAAMHKTC